MLTVQNALLFLSALLSSLIAGLLYGYACSVNPGLHKLADAEYIRAMQSINKAIINPFFFVSFMGTLVVLPIATWYSRYHASTTCFYLLLAATLVYFIGVMGVTAFGNIALNNALARFDTLTADAKAMMQQRQSFELRWNIFHLVRTLFSILCTALTIAAAIKK